MSEPRNRRRRKRRLPEESIETNIHALSSEGRGIAHVNEQTVFIDYALESESVEFKYTKLTKKVAEGRAVNVLKASPHRVAPDCDVFTICGGCNLQHMQHAQQITHKQSMLLDQLERIGQVKPVEVLAPVTAETLHYRHKARLGVRYVQKKEKALVGFRERGSSFITETSQCHILHNSVGDIISGLSALISSVDAKARIAQIEVAVGDNQTVLVFRNLDPLSDVDKTKLIDFAKQNTLVIYLQPGSPDKLEPLWPESPEVLYYVLPDYDVRIEFMPSDFTQVNPDINKKMIHAALQYLEIADEDQVLDLFCGLGNFSLPLARHCKQVTAVEGTESMVKKARANALLNKINNVDFICTDLYSEQISNAPWLVKQYDKILLDPPRSGAGEILKYIKKMAAKRIVYVSCHPATLARDANILVNELGYKLTKAGVLDMFPHTSHVESIAVFEK